MARTPSTRRFSWVLTAVLLGAATLPAVALEASTGPLVGQAPEALRLQKQVVAWLEANPGASVVFRARALINLGVCLSGVGQRQEALAPTLEATRLLRPLEGGHTFSPVYAGAEAQGISTTWRDSGKRNQWYFGM
jgi:hypothetical protein